MPAPWTPVGSGAGDSQTESEALQMSMLCYRAGIAISAAAVAAASGQSFTAGNLVVYRTGDGAAALAAAATPVFLQEFTTAGASGITVALPVTASGANHACTNH